jgi:hypothetical protein
VSRATKWSKHMYVGDAFRETAVRNANVIEGTSNRHSSLVRDQKLPSFAIAVWSELLEHQSKRIAVCFLLRQGTARRAPDIEHARALLLSL